MPQFIDLNAFLPIIIAFGMATVRLGFLFITLPVLSSNSFPVNIKIAVVAVLSITVIFSLPDIPLLSFDLFSIAIAVFGEAVLGSAAGLSARIVFATAETAGQVMGVPMGLGFSRSIDPLTNDESVVTSQLLGLIVSLLFIMLDIHLVVIRYIIESFKEMPPGKVVLTGEVGLHLAQKAAIMFNAAVSLAAPVLVVLLGVMISLGVLARIAPKVNLFVLSFGISIGVGLIALKAALPNIVAYSRMLMTRVEPFLGDTLQRL